MIGTRPQEYIPYKVIAPHELRAIKNHAQTLTQLAERGGLTWGEIWAILTDQDWQAACKINPDAAKEAVMSIIKSMEGNI